MKDGLEKNSQPETPTDAGIGVDLRVRPRFCWHCGRKLYGNKFAQMRIDGGIRTLHKLCKEQIEQGFYPGEYDLETNGAERLVKRLPTGYKKRGCNWGIYDTGSGLWAGDKYGNHWGFRTKQVAEIYLRHGEEPQTWVEIAQAV